MPAPHAATVAQHLNGLAVGLFLLTAFALVAIRQLLTCLKLFVLQAVLLAASAALRGYELASIHLFVLAGVTLASKAVVLPWLLRRTVHREVYDRREVSQVLSIPTSLLIAAGLALFAYLVASPLLEVADGPFTRVNLPIGIAGVLLGAYTVTVRREAVPQVLGILAMENGAFLAGVAVAPDLPLIAELAAAFDVLIVALVMGILTRRIQDRVGTTVVGELASLREE